MTALPAGMERRRPAVRRRVRLWIPLILVLVLLSPLLALLLLMFAVYAWTQGVRPTRALKALVQLSLSLPGTRVEIETPSASIVVAIL